MNDKRLKNVDAILEMEKYLSNQFNHSPKKRWENTFIKHQIDRRARGDTFSINEHIRAMVYSMLSSGISWDRVESLTDLKTGKILLLDEWFHQYDPDFLTTCDPITLRDGMKELHLASQYTMKQMTALVKINIPKLKEIKQKSKDIDVYYRQFISSNGNTTCLIKQLSSLESPNKFVQMGVALTAEYLRNIGYDLAKPDRHICKILGRDYLGFSENQDVPTYEVIDIVSDLAAELKKSAAEIDYILWAYCADGFGEVCTKNNPKCKRCIVNTFCSKRRIKNAG